jgi:anti-sigma factor RsiW
MTAPRAQHPSPDDLAAFAVGRLGGSAAAAVAAHLEKCPACRRAAARAPAAARPRNVAAAEGVTAPTAQPGAPLPPTTPAAGGPPPELTGHPRYRVLRELGRGGMGVVYQAEQTMMDRQVAIKVISSSLLTSADALERFRREVRAAAKLVHPNIVVAYDAEQAGDLHMLVMEFVPGHTLAQVLRQKGRLPVALACQYVRQAALGLQHADEHGMAHRDIKPQNLMLTPKGQVKILDFGLAKLATEQGAGGLTSVNAYMGTPEYTAPEQAQDASSADIRADIYSLGCTLYCLLAGRPPFQGDTPVQTILAHIEQQPRPLTELRDDVPAGLWAVVERMLAKDKTRRYQKPGEVVQALAPFAKPRSRVAAAPAAPVGVALPDQATARPRDTGPMPVLTPAPAPAAPAPAARVGLGCVLSGVLLVVAGLALAGGFAGGLYLLQQAPPGGTSAVVPDTDRPDTAREHGTVPPAKSAEPQHPDGVEHLFNGKDLTGWALHGGGTGAWRVENGILVSGGRPSYLYYGNSPKRLEFEDFELVAEAMINDGGNSGVFFRCSYAPGLPDGYEAQINATARDPHRTGSLYLHRRSNSLPVPGRLVRVEPNEWFRYEVSARGNHIVLRVNGTEVLDYTDQLNTFRKGRLALQQWDRETVVRFRRIDIKELPPSPRTAGGR